MKKYDAEWWWGVVITSHPKTDRFVYSKAHVWTNNADVGARALCGRVRQVDTDIENEQDACGGNGRCKPCQKLWRNS
jgi:hypothetical protein